MALNRVELAAKRGWTTAEVYKAIDAWRKLYKRQPKSTLTLVQYFDKLQEAGLRPSMLGLRRGKYSLARYNDLGPYTVDNCRFIPIEENVAERKEGYQKDPKFRQRMSVIALARPRFDCPHCEKKATPAMFSRWHGDNCKLKAA